MREIVTIQAGNYANFVGSHFWNFQDELLGLADSTESDQIFKSHGLNMDVLYRPGETQQGILTYTPRLVSMGLRGSLGSMSSHGTLYKEIQEAQVGSLTWTGPVTTQTSQPLQKNLFLQSLDWEENSNVDRLGAYENEQNEAHAEIQDKDIVESLENDIQYWTDFSKVHYHPQSLYELCGLWTDSKDFNNYGIGREAFSGGLHAEQVNDRLRFFLEECDHPQGIQFIVDDSGGFSGVAGEVLEIIADDYPNIPVLLYSVRSPDSCLDPSHRKLTIARRLHNAVSFAKQSALCKLIVPIGLPSLSTSKMSKYLYLEDRKPYHTSAVYASALHSISLPFRMEPHGPSAQYVSTSGAVTMNDLIQILAGQGCQNMVAVLDASMPAPALTGTGFQQPLLETLQPLTPETAEDVEDMQALESMIIHGAFASGSERASVCEVTEAVQAAYTNAVRRPKFSHLSVAQCPLPIPLPYPSIFGKFVGERGELLNTQVSDSSSSRGSLEVHSVPMAARLRSSIAILPFLDNRLQNLRKLGIARGALGSEILGSWGFGRDDVEDIGETLSDMVTKLNPRSEASSDSD
ncbi:protein misato homolog 1-like isoform X1 [Salvia splendens]|uniref:protein misato homolog 1-like isoform X1 n=1 Tax=Salvia splendens TaxID=180675 RepID=UPI001C27B0DC|nr:protein misato homolog 1-like isoform X1 [Salvia splendens]XP_042004837.1 protein misato homolog 1-like isoform X1 [Salvia splendens]